MPRLLRRTLIAIVGAGALAACGDGESVHEFSEVRELRASPGLVPEGTTSEIRFGSTDPHAGMTSLTTAGSDDSMGMPAMGSAATDINPLLWTIPEGWSTKAGTRMRLVTTLPPDTTDTECYLSVLGADGGGLSANLNRWRSQMGRPGFSPEEVERLETIPLLEGRGVLVRFDGSFQGLSGKAIDKATLYGMVSLQPEFVLFAKMKGPTSEMKPHWDAFVALCKSVRQ